MGYGLLQLFYFQRYTKSTPRSSGSAFSILLKFSALRSTIAPAALLLQAVDGLFNLRTEFRLEV